MARGRVDGGSSDARAQWRERLRRFDKREGTVAAFCEAESVSTWSLYDWRRKLQATEAAAPDSTRAERPSFVDVGAMRASAADRDDAAPAAGIELRIDLGGGLVLQILRR